MSVTRRPVLKRRQRGLTLLEVLIALSIFALIGVASFRVLSSVVDAQQTGAAHSQQLARFQKALLMIDTDLQQLLTRDIRSAGDQRQAYLLIDSDERYTLQLTRGGWPNPLQLPRSSMQRVAYDIGRHPQANDRDSEFYGSQRNYLRRHYWLALDRSGDSAPQVQLLLADIDELQVSVLSERGRHSQWPPARSTNDDGDLRPLAIEFAFVHPLLGKMTRLYKVN